MASVLALATALALGASPAQASAPALASAVGAAAAVAVAAPDAVPALAAAPVTTGPAGMDYATEVFNDPWDYSNSADMITNFSGTQRTADLRFGQNMLQTHLTANSAYLSPVWGGYSDTVLNGRDAGLPQNAVNASRYNAMALQIYSNAAAKTNFYIVWSRCPNLVVASSCSGRSGFVYLRPGWNTYVVPLGATGGRNGSMPLDWAGSINGMRIVFNAGSSDLKVDWTRLYRRTSGLQLAIPYLNTRDLVWDQNNLDSDNTGASSPAPLTGTSGPGWGVLPKNTPDWRAAVNGSTADLSFLPANSFRIGTRSGPGRPVSWYRQVNLIAPLPELITPNERGDVDYATARTGDAWDMRTPSDLSSSKNIRITSWAGGNLTGTNAGPKFNDPQMSMRLARAGIDSRTFHHLTVTMSLDGKYNLGGQAGGGTVARVLWRRADHPTSDQIVTSRAVGVFPGTQQITLDLGMATSKVVISRAAWPFVSASPITQLRVDPDEDPADGSNGAAPRGFHVDNVELRSDFTSDGTFPVTWRDLSGQPGGVAVLRLTRTPNVCAGSAFATVPVKPGVNTTLLDTHALPAGAYYVCLQIKRGGGGTNRIARGAIIVRHAAAAPAAPTMTRPTATRNGGRVDVAWAPATGSVSGYQAHELYGNSYLLSSTTARRTYVKCPNPSARAVYLVRAYGRGGLGPWSPPTHTIPC